MTDWSSPGLTILPHVQMVVIWNTDRASSRGQVSVMAKAHTDVDIVRMRIAAFDDTRSVTQ